MKSYAAGGDVPVGPRLGQAARSLDANARHVFEPADEYVPGPHDDIEAASATRDLRDEGARFPTADQGETFTLEQWARHAIDSGMSLADIKALPNGTTAERIKAPTPTRNDCRGTFRHFAIGFTLNEWP